MHFYLNIFRHGENYATWADAEGIDATDAVRRYVEARKLVANYDGATIVAQRLDAAGTPVAAATAVRVSTSVLTVEPAVIA